jgi:hypothetical protein
MHNDLQCEYNLALWSHYVGGCRVVTYKEEAFYVTTSSYLTAQ